MQLDLTQITTRLMKSGIQFIKNWFDIDLIELKIEVSDGISLFSNRVYISHETLPDMISDLNVLRDHIHGGLLDIRLGEFGPEYANGAFHARFHFQQLGKLYITCRQQSRFEKFPLREVANEATIHLKTEPVLLDNFIVGLKALSNGNSEEAYLESVE